MDPPSYHSACQIPGCRVSSVNCEWISSLLYPSWCSVSIRFAPLHFKHFRPSFKINFNRTLHYNLRWIMNIRQFLCKRSKRTWQFILLRSIFFLFCALKGQIARHMMANTLTYLVTCYYCCKNNHDSTAAQVKPTSYQNHAKTMGRSIAKIKKTQILTDSNLLRDSVPS